MKVGIAPFKPRMRDGSGREMGQGRGAGLHQSDIIKHIRETLVGKYTGGDDAFAMTGFMWETIVGKALATYCGFDMKGVIEPGEYEMDGVLLTPDRVDPKRKIVYEFKATWFSMRHLVASDADGTERVNIAGLQETHWTWLMQIMGYCRALGYRRARLVVFWVNGDYSRKPPRGGPCFRAIELEFTVAEIEANWKMLLDNAADLQRVEEKA